MRKIAMGLVGTGFVCGLLIMGCGRDAAAPAAGRAALSRDSAMADAALEPVPGVFRPDAAIFSDRGREQARPDPATLARLENLVARDLALHQAPVPLRWGSRPLPGVAGALTRRDPAALDGILAMAGPSPLPAPANATGATPPPAPVTVGVGDDWTVADSGDAAWVKPASSQESDAVAAARAVPVSLTRLPVAAAGPAGLGGGMASPPPLPPALQTLSATKPAPAPTAAPIAARPKPSKWAMPEDLPASALAPLVQASAPAPKPTPPPAPAPSAGGEAPMPPPPPPAPISPAPAVDPAAEAMLSLARDEEIRRQRALSDARDLVERGDRAVAAMDYDAARDFYARALVLDPEQRAARVGLSRVQTIMGEGIADGRQALERTRQEQERIAVMTRGAVDEAMGLVASSLEKREGDEGDFSRRKGDVDKAEQLLGQAARTLSTSPVAGETERGLQARIMTVREEALAARDALSREQEAAARAESLRRTEALAREDRLRTEGALTQLLTQAKDAMRKGRYALAEQLFEEVLKNDKFNVAATQGLRDCRATSIRTDDLRARGEIPRVVEEYNLQGTSRMISLRNPIEFPADWAEKSVQDRARREVSLSEQGRELRAKLDTIRLSLDIIEDTLRNVLDQISEQSGVNILYDQRDEALLNRTFGLRDVKNMTLRNVLEWVREITATASWTVKDDHIWFGRDVFEEKRIAVFIISDLAYRFRDWRYRSTIDIEGLNMDDEEDTRDAEEQELRDEEGYEQQTFPYQIIEEFLEPYIDDPEIGGTFWSSGRDMNTGSRTLDFLVVRHYPHILERIRQNLESRRRLYNKQVLVEAKIMEVRENALDEFGVRWGQGGDAVTGADRSGVNYTKYKQGGTNTIWGSYVPSFGSDVTRLNAAAGEVGDYVQGSAGGLYAEGMYITNFFAGKYWRRFAANAAVTAVTAKQNGVILHNPQLLVQNGYWAYTRITQDTRYVADYDIVNNMPSPVIETMSTGVVWQVKPTVSFDEKYIRMAIRPQLISTNPHPYTFSYFIIQEGRRFDYVRSITLPWPSVYDMRATLTVPDGGTVLTGSVLQDSRQRLESGIPMLSNVPYLGKLFRSRSRNFTKSNLLFVIYGKVLDTSD